MALTIRLRKQGRNNRQTFRVVVTDERCPRDGKYIEMLGWYDPLLSGENVSMNGERLQYWLSQGAQPSTQVELLMKKAAGDVLKEYTAKRMESRAKMAKKRRALRKSAKGG